MAPKNIFSNIPEPSTDEFSEELVRSGSTTIERIVSHGHASPKSFWYDQESDEWVILLKGRAKVLFEGGRPSEELQAGDYLDIPAHTKHRLEWTDPREDTVWLAVHYG